MTAAERLNNLLRGKKIDRPPFMPAIYDLKPALTGRPSHTFGQDVKELVDALTFEVEQLGADAMTVGYDIYNIEAEAAGCSVLRDPGIWMPEIVEPILNSLDQVNELNRINSPVGRMGIFIRAAEEMLHKYGGNIPVRGGISGPFSMATKLFPKEELLMKCVLDPGSVMPLLRFCTETIKVYAGGFAETGAGVIVFDSFVAPPMIPPQTYHELVQPFHREIFDLLAERDVHQRTLIIGGNTIPIIHDIVSTGATQFLLDFTIPIEEVSAVLDEFPDNVFRVNLPPGLLTSKDSIPIIRAIENLVHVLKSHRNIIIGTGILPPNVPAENIRLVKKYILDYYI